MPFVTVLGRCVGVVVDNLLFRIQADRCRSIAEKADEFTKRRLIALAERYEKQMSRKTTRVPAVQISPAHAETSLQQGLFQGRD